MAHGISKGQNVDFSYSLINSSLCSPSTINFNAITNAIPKGYLWDFGNGRRSNNPAPSTNYNLPGTYTVKLILVFDNLTKEVSKQIVISPGITIAITAQRTQICSPDTIHFNSTTTGNISQYIWNFGDNSPILTGNNPSPSHFYANLGHFVVSVKAISPNGCQATHSRIIRVSKPDLIGSYNISSGCVPVTNNFRSRVNLPPGSAVLDYTWNFGDGSTLTNTSPIVNHTYTNAGEFEPSLIIRTTDGCSSTFLFDTVRYGTPPANITAYASMNRFCASEKVNFVARANLANRYDWRFGNGNTITTYDTITTHQFRSIGLKNIVVTPRYNECASAPMRIVVRVEGAVSRFIYNNTCEEKKTFQFTNNSLGNVNQAIWNIDDLNRTLTQNNISITFPNNGAYWISLAVQDSATGCKDTSKVKILTATPELFTAADTLCVNTHAAFQVKNTYANNATTYSWQTLNLSPQISSDSIFSPFADSLGIYPYNTVIISNGRGYCNDTLSLNHPVLIKGPKANFHTQTEICQAQSLSFDNRTVHYPNQSESMMYSWDLGDNSPSIQSFTPIPHQFATDGQYTIKMTATDTYGCKDSVENIVQVRPMPFLWILPRSKTICQGQNFSLTGFTSDQISWTTSLPSNPFCNTCDSNLIAPPHTTTYKAVSTNQYLCAATDSITITVMEPFTASIQPPQASICEKETISLALSPSGKMVSWTPDPTLNTSNPYLPVAQPTSSKRFEVVLSDSLNCFSSTAGIHVQVNPLPTVELGENKMLSWGTLYNLNPAYSSNVRSFLWTPADKLNCSTCPNPQITVKSLEQIGVKVTSDSGCVNTDKISLAVECNNAYLLMPGAFTPDGDGLNDIYYPITRGMKYIKRFSIYNRSSQLMFQRQDCFPNDRQAGWNGKFKGESQPPGTYVYVIEAVCEFGLSTIKSGSFVLIR